MAINSLRLVKGIGPMMCEGVGGSIKAIMSGVGGGYSFGPSSTVKSIDGDEDMFFRSPVMRGLDYMITGLTKDGAGAALGSCRVELYYTNNDQPLSAVISDATTGAYTFRCSPVFTYYAVGYLAGSPDKAGTTVNTLAPVGV